MRLLRQRSKVLVTLVFTGLFLGVLALWQVGVSFRDEGNINKQAKELPPSYVTDTPVKRWQINLTSTQQKDGTAHKAESAVAGDHLVKGGHDAVSALHPDVRVVPSTPSNDLVLPFKDCVPLPNSPKPEARICLHPVSEDKYVSGALKGGQLWESHLLYQMTRALQADPNLQLVDLGCNIGEYTLWAAAMGRHVLAVEMLESNIHLVQTSLLLSNFSSLVTLVNNALYRDHRKLQTTFLEGNLGGSRLNDSSINDPNVVIDTKKKSVTVNTVCIDDLVPLLKDKSVYLKIDIENSEHHALACAHNFFTEVDVKIVQMEWLDRGLEEVTEISDFMHKHGYVPSLSALQHTAVDINVPTINGHDVFFLKTRSNKTS